MSSPNGIDPTSINCAEACVNGCVLGDQCPNREHLESARKLIAEKSIDQILEIAAERLRRQWGQSSQ